MINKHRAAALLAMAASYLPQLASLLQANVGAVHHLSYCVHVSMWCATDTECQLEAQSVY